MEIYQHGYCWKRAYVLVVNFRIKAVVMATSHLMTDTHFPHFDLVYSSIFWLSFGKFFSNFATSWKWYCLTFYVKKSSFRRLFQYSVICHSSKYIRLPLTDFNKNWVFYRICMWLQLSRIEKKIHRRKCEKTSIYLLRWCHKNQKNTCGTRMVIHLRCFCHLGSNVER